MNTYTLRPCTLREVDALCVQFHAYRGAGGMATYAFGVYEVAGVLVRGRERVDLHERLVAAYAWQPPPPGAAKSVCSSCPEGVLSLSRMVAVPRDERALNHVSRPLRRQMQRMIDRTRWPVLVTYSDEGQGHTGHTYKCSGWRPTRRRRTATFEDVDGARASKYRDGRDNRDGLTRTGTTTIQRWEHHAAEDPAAHMAAAGWRRVPIEGKRWRSGAQAYTYVRICAADCSPHAFDGETSDLAWRPPFGGCRGESLDVRACCSYSPPQPAACVAPSG